MLNPEPISSPMTVTTCRHKGLFLPGALVYTLALATRLVFLTQGVNNPMLRIPAIDESINWEVAKTIRHGQLRPTPYARSPGYMYVLAGLAVLAREESFCVRVVQIFFDSFSPVLIFLIGVELFGTVAGLIAGLLGAVFWTCILFAGQLVDTSLTCLICLLLAYLLVRLPEERWWTWLVCGLLAGVSATVRPNLLAFAPLLAAAMVAKAGCQRFHGNGAAYRRIDRLKEALFRGMLLILGCILGVVPVTLRNRCVGGEWVPICISGGANLWISNRPGADGRDVAPCFDSDPTPLVFSKDDDPWENCLTYHLWLRYGKKHLGEHARASQIDRLFTRMTREHIFGRPWSFVVSYARRLAWTFDAYEFPNHNDPYEFLRFSWLLRVLSALHFGVVCPFALFGMTFVLVTRRNQPVGTVGYWVLIVTLIATGAVFVICARYRLPMICLMLPFAGYGMVQTAHWVGHIRTRTRALAGVVVLLLAFGVFCNADFFDYRPQRRPTYLYWFFARVCDEVADKELLPVAMAELGREMVADAEASTERESMATLIRRYQHPFGYLAQYAVRERRWDDALRYGDYMLRYEPYSEANTRLYAFNVLIGAARAKEPMVAYAVLEQIAPVFSKSNPEVLQEYLRSAGVTAKSYFVEKVREAVSMKKPKAAFDALERLAPVLQKNDPAMLGEFSLLLGKGAKDKKLLTTAVRIFETLSSAKPTDPTYGDKLEEARRQLEAVSQENQSSLSLPSSGAAGRQGQNR